jgi:uncharacterized cupin superfamily protein
MEKYLIKKSEIETMEGRAKEHYLNPEAQRVNKSLGDLTGLTGFGFHIIDVPPGKESTEYHRHLYEDEATYVLAGTGKVVIDDKEYMISPGDFIGYRAGGKAHTMINTGDSVLRCIVVGERLNHDVCDYPRKNKRLFRNDDMPWNLVDLANVQTPNAGKK